MQKWLDLLVDKYSVDKKVVLKDSNTVCVDNTEYPLLPWRSERRFIEMKSLVDCGDINGISVMRTLRITNRGTDLVKELYREFDIAQFMLSTKIVEVFAIGDEQHAINVIAKTEAGYICTFEMAASLSEDAEIIDKHEIIAISGVACDRAVDTQVPQKSLYVYGASATPEAYMDVDFELYGLTLDQCAVVRSAFDVAQNGKDFTQDVLHLNRLTSAVKTSMADTVNVVIREGE